MLAAVDRVALSRRVEVHDATHLELKLDYGVPTRGRRVDYVVELYFFFPGSLDVSPVTFAPRELYPNLHAYLRFKTPELAADELVSLRAEGSPLARLQAAAEVAASGAPWDVARLVEEAKLFGCLARAYLRDTSRHLGALAGARVEAGHLGSGPFRASVERYRERARGLLEAYRRVRRLFDSAPGELPAELAEALEAVELLVSYEYERRVARLLARLQREEPEVADALGPGFLEDLRGERRYREVHRLPPGPAADAEEENEAFLRRFGNLKKFVSSALYLNQRRAATQEEWADWVGALAAGLAMAVAYAAHHLLQHEGGGLNATVVGTVVLVYVMKDRLKDMVKRRLSAENLRWLADHDWRVLDCRDGGQIGRCQEIARWVEPAQVPEVIERLRATGAETSPGLRRATGETVLWYQKHVTLYPPALHARHARRHDVNDILRVGVGRFLAHLDSSRTRLHALAPEGDRVVPLRARRTYPLNLVLRYAARGQPATVEKLRLQLDAAGIQGVDVLVPPTPEDEVGREGPPPARETWLRGEE